MTSSQCLAVILTHYFLFFTPQKFLFLSQKFANVAIANIFFKKTNNPLILFHWSNMVFWHWSLCSANHLIILILSLHSWKKNIQCNKSAANVASFQAFFPLFYLTLGREVANGSMFHTKFLVRERLFCHLHIRKSQCLLPETSKKKKAIIICRNRILECMAWFLLVLVHNVPFVKYDGTSPLCDVSILNKCVCWEGCLHVCGHVSETKVEPKKLLLKRGLLFTFVIFILIICTLRNVRGQERLLYLVYWTELIQKGLMRTWARVREDAGLSSGYMEERRKMDCAWKGTSIWKPHQEKGPESDGVGSAKGGGGGVTNSRNLSN